MVEYTFETLSVCIFFLAIVLSTRVIVAEKMGPQYRDVKVILSIMGTALIVLGSALLGISDKSYNISVFITTAFFLENAYWAFIEWNVLQFAKEKSKIISHTVLSVISTVMVVYCAINEIGISAY